MKLFKIYLLLLPLSIIISCNNDDPKEEIQGVEVKSVNAISCVDLSNRSDWEFRVMNIPYDYTANGKNIMAKVKEQSYYFHNSYPQGTNIPIGGGPVIQLVSPDYYAVEKSKSTPPLPPNIHDQTSIEKLRKADVLSNYYYGNVSEDLVNVELTHANALLEFELINIPSDAEVKVSSYMDITPYREEDNNYKAIVLAEGGEYDATISVRIGGTPYQVSVLSATSKSSPLPASGYILRDTHYKFTVKFDEDKKSLSIENMQRTKWSKQYPIELVYKTKEIVDFKLFIGSPNGPVEISTDQLNPAQFWGDRLNFYPTRLTFTDENTMFRTPNDTSADLFTYKFKQDSLFRYNNNVEEWFWAATGDHYTLKYHIGYYRCNYFDSEFWDGTGIHRFNIGQDNYIASESGLYGSVHSLNSLKLETDTIMWCNINYIYTAPNLSETFIIYLLLQSKVIKQIE